MERKHQKNDHQNGPVHGVKANEQHQVTNAHDFEVEHGRLAGQRNEFFANQEHHSKTKAPSTHGHKITIFVDHQPYYIEHPQLTGAEIRNLPAPPISPELDLFHVINGNGGNVKMSDTDLVTINPNESKHGRHFVSQIKSNGHAHQTQPSHAQIASVAYDIYEKRGYPSGEDQAHWQEAEQQLKQCSKE